MYKIREGTISPTPGGDDPASVAKILVALRATRLLVIAHPAGGEIAAEPLVVDAFARDT